MTVEESLFKEHIGKPVLVDANLLLLLMIGSFDRDLIHRFKRTSDYSTKHYDLLIKLLEYFSGVLTTPHILTEVSNLANALPEWVKWQWGEHFRARIPLFQEHFHASTELRLQSGFVKFGLTDSALEQMAEHALVFTNDRRIGGYLRSTGKAVLVFDDLFQISEALSMEPS